jgi:hypothetical protein
MKKILPNALFIGFTGTPLLKADKQKSIEVFGRHIHTDKSGPGVQSGGVAGGLGVPMRGPVTAASFVPPLSTAP